MSRVGLAFRCFFRVLFRGELPAEAAERLPESVRPGLPAPSSEARPTAREEPRPAESSTAPGTARSSATERAGEGAATPVEAAAPAGGAAARGKAPASAPSASRDQHRDGALALLALLQREGRLVDFLREPIDDYDDSDIGAAVRDIHRGCRKVIEDYLSIEPVMPGSEDQAITIPRGFDPGEVRLIGEVKGDPPFKGTLRHHGWRVTRASLPSLTDGVDRHVLAPAEVEVS